MNAAFNLYSVVFCNIISAEKSRPGSLYWCRKFEWAVILLSHPPGLAGLRQVKGQVSDWFRGPADALHTPAVMLLPLSVIVVKPAGNIYPTSAYCSVNVGCFNIAQHPLFQTFPWISHVTPPTFTLTIFRARCYPLRVNISLQPPTNFVHSFTGYLSAWTFL